MLQLMGGAGAAVMLGGVQTAEAQSAFGCVLMPEMTEGPYWVDEKLNRSDIRVDPSDGSIRPGRPMNLTVTVYAVNGSACGLLPGAAVDIWHCDAGGLYSDVAMNNTVGKKFLRGYQVTNNSGVARFTTIYPGWYSGRTVHIHLRVRTYSGAQVLGQFTSQLFFDDAVTDEVFAVAPYNTRGARNTRNSNDNIYQGAATRDRTMLTLTKTADGYDAAISIGVNLPAGTTVTTSFAMPQMAFGGGWATALYLTNTTSAATTAQVNFVGADGSPMLAPVTGAGSVSSRTVELAARGTESIEVTGGTDLQQGWAELALPDGVIGYGVFRQSVEGRAAQEAVVPLITETSRAADLTFDDSGFTTAVALANPSEETVTVTVAVYGTGGALIGSSPVTLGPRAKTSVVLRDLPGLSGVAGTKGWAAISVANGAVSALGLRFGAEAFTSIPVTHK